MGVVAAHASALLVGLPRRLGGAGMFVAELNVVMDEIADRPNALNLRPRRNCDA
jgi:hypothetical protein